MVFVMVQGSHVRGVFDTVWEAKVHFSDTTNVPIKDVVEETHLNGDTLLKVNGYCQARLKQTVYR